MRASTWPDEIRNQRGYIDDGIRPPGRPTDTQNIGYSDRLLHRYWHFKNLEFSPDRTRTRPAASPNAETQIRAFTAALGSTRTSDNIRSYDLVWLMHLVGDVHQPLHATARFTRSTPQGDGGGNQVNVCDPDCDKTLHSFWDGPMGPPGVPTEEEIREVAATPVSQAQVRVSDPRVWLQESFGFAQSHVYVSPIGLGRSGFHITDDYRTSARNLAKERMALAAIRLANLINQSRF